MNATQTRNQCRALEAKLLKGPARPMQLAEGRGSRVEEGTIQQLMKLEAARDRVVKWSKRYARTKGKWNEMQLKRAVAALEKLEDK